mgnify:CR=1 FL=1
MASKKGFEVALLPHPLQNGTLALSGTKIAEDVYSEGERYLEQKLHVRHCIGRGTVSIWTITDSIRLVGAEGSVSDEMDTGFEEMIRLL